MSQVVINETKDQLLHDLPPTLQALTVFLTKQNKGLRIYELMNYVNIEKGKAIHVMSDGLCYCTDAEDKWYIL